MRLWGFTSSEPVKTEWDYKIVGIVAVLQYSYGIIPLYHTAIKDKHTQYFGSRESAFSSLVHSLIMI